MATEPVHFENQNGVSLAGRLEIPDGPTRAWAIFAHCFTCSKDSLAAVTIARALAKAGIGVLRFDFTGLGESEGAFSDSGYSSDVQDVVAAARWLQDAYDAPQLLIGHSLGGAAVLSAKQDLESMRAVATIGAPFQPDHVTKLFAQDLDTIRERGEAKVQLGERHFTIKKRLLKDLHGVQQAKNIAGLDCALLVMHAPLDNIVSIDEATGIFLAAKHPKSFVSLDTATHLLTDKEDGAYVAALIVAWASRYWNVE